MKSSPPSLLAFPMHGQQKLLNEGYRTRDGHFIEWFGRQLDGRGPIWVVSRPEPHLLRPLVRGSARSLALNTEAVDRYSWRIPNIMDRRSWWVQSRNAYPMIDVGDRVPAVVWNPMVGISNAAPLVFNGRRRVVVDLLDDWSIHYAFKTISKQVDEAYRRCLGEAATVTANSEGTIELAKRFGRHDAVLLTNGCDPERFLTVSNASGDTTVGYVGKIGHRVDLELVLSTARALPGLKFVFAGPILDREYVKPLESVDNIVLLGDVHYDDVPELLTSFDIGWVPHRVGDFEIGGDVIKTYEYRAAHLPVLTTPVMGAGDRGLDHVYVLDANHHEDWLRKTTADGERVARMRGEIPSRHTWCRKSGQILEDLKLISR